MRHGALGVAQDVAVVLVGDPRLVADVGRGEQRQQVGTRVRGTGKGGAAVGLHRVEPLRAGDRTLVDRAVVGDGTRRHVDDRLAVPGDDEPVAVGDLAEDGGLDVPAAGDLEEGVELVGRDDGHHPLLRLRHEDLLRAEGRVTQRHLVELDLHAAVAGGGQLGGRAGQAGATEVLDALDDARGVEVEAALDEDLLREGVTDLDGGPLGRAALLEGLRGEDGDATDAVAARLGAEEHDLVAGAGRVGEVEVLVAQRADAQRVDERVALVALVEDDLAADVGQAEGVAVAADALDDARQDARGVGVVDGAKAKGVHHRDRAGAHRHDVADDAADAGRGTLVGLDIARVVVRLDLEGHRPTLADVDDAGVLADAGEGLAQGGLGGQVAEALEVDLGGLVAAVLGPHDRVHRQLGARRAAVEDLADALVLVGLETELGPRLLGVGAALRDGHGVEVADGHADTTCSRTDVKKVRPSRLGPKPSSTACSGCGMRPTTLPRSLVMPAMPREEPLGLSPT